MTLTDLKVFIYHLPDFILKFNFYRIRKIKQYFKKNRIRKLQIGCGANIISGWLNTDISLYVCRRGAIYMDASKKFPLPDNSIDYIYSEHIFEHLSYEQGVSMLKECYRVLKHDGVIRLATPNLQFLMELYSNPTKEINQQYIEWSTNSFLNRNINEKSAVYVINNFHTSWGHKIIYDYNTIANLFKSIGFCDITSCEIGTSTQESLKNIEHHQFIIPEKFNQLESLIIEAKVKHE